MNGKEEKTSTDLKAMNIYDFFSSPDIAAHCQKLEHCFSPLDMAIIVAKSNKPMKEKHSAYRAIINDYPDMPIHESLNFNATDSLHNYLRELITWEEAKIAEFYKRAQNEVYRQRVWVHAHNASEGGCLERCGASYSSVENTFNAIIKDWDINENTGENIYKIGVVKEVIDTDKRTTVWMNFNGEITDIYHFYGLSATLDDLSLIFFHLPIPFEKGDIVSMGCDDKPRVLTDVPHWYTGDRSYKHFVSGKCGDGSDMLGRYYYIEENGRLIHDHGIGDMHRIRYFKGELKGQERFLKYLSQYIKSKDESIDWLIDVFCKYKAEAELEKANSLFGGWYIDLEEEKLKGVGL